MRKALLAFVTVVIVVAAAQPAVAIDEGFRGRYRVIWREIPGHSCLTDSGWYRVRIRYVGERARGYDRFGPGPSRTLRYVRGERFPWRYHAVSFRYNPRTDSAVGRHPRPQGCWQRLRLVPIG
jgi:hypothetical protein